MIYSLRRATERRRGEQVRNVDHAKDREEASRKCELDGYKQVDMIQQQ